ncbi:unnamed protein product [Ranitomeya imitator]|uniref:phospholipid-hydroperoxide glutathione peroxidase n=1 Tax=Ranitomeya imitator TaxID=111125 RepID=A0ABN9MD88_9NEOB|nr:unnamed protein product [Ranitomeya imitator]
MFNIGDACVFWVAFFATCVVSDASVGRKKMQQVAFSCAHVDDWKKAKSIYEFSATDIDGSAVSLEKYRGFVCIIEPGDEAQIKDFAASYQVKFDMFSKIDVNGDGAHPLWKWMKAQPKGRGTLGDAIKWNFTKVIEKDLPDYI